uniref:Uncharacterized protein n=1 Tax=Arundo donax TaxID=35708 RepID=A0A0A9DCY4_ARUDO
MSTDSSILSFILALPLPLPINSNSFPYFLSLGSSQIDQIPPGPPHWCPCTRHCSNTVLISRTTTNFSTPPLAPAPPAHFSSRAASRKRLRRLAPQAPCLGSNNRREDNTRPPSPPLRLRLFLQRKTHLFRLAAGRALQAPLPRHRLLHLLRTSVPRERGGEPGDEAGVGAAGGEAVPLA